MKTKVVKWKEEFDKKFPFERSHIHGGWNMFNPSPEPTEIKFFISNLLSQQEKEIKEGLREKFEGIIKAEIPEGARDTSIWASDLLKKLKRKGGEIWI